MSTISQEFRKDDLLTGLKTGKNYISAAVVAMVALALSIALAIASGGTPMMGLQAAIYGPFV
jgi:MFS superfamily sulfate permease-like transporter